MLHMLGRYIQAPTYPSLVSVSADTPSLVVYPDHNTSFKAPSATTNSLGKGGVDLYDIFQD